MKVATKMAILAKLCQGLWRRITNGKYGNFGKETIANIKNITKMPKITEEVMSHLFTGEYSKNGREDCTGKFGQNDKSFCWRIPKVSFSHYIFNSQGLGEKDISKFCFLKTRKIKFFLP